MYSWDIAVRCRKADRVAPLALALPCPHFAAILKVGKQNSLSAVDTYTTCIHSFHRDDLPYPVLPKQSDNLMLRFTNRKGPANAGPSHQNGQGNVRGWVACSTSRFRPPWQPYQTAAWLRHLRGQVHSRNLLLPLCTWLWLRRSFRPDALGSCHP